MQLSPETLRQVQQFVILAQHHEQLAQAMRASLYKVVQDETGVDLEDGDWNLDPETGEMNHVTTD